MAHYLGVSHYGLFDAFTGKSAEDAASQKRRAYQQYGTQGKSIFDTGLANELPNLNSAHRRLHALSNLGQKYGHAPTFT